MNTMHLFAGGGGGMYADLILGHTPTVAVEWEKAACDVLRARKSEWWPECEIIEGDIRAFSGVEYAGKVDCIHAGFPCQDLSVAGKRAGMDGDRSSLYVEAIRIFREVRPRYLFIENVTGITSANGGEALNRVMSDLAEIGLDARWTCLRASDVGANHRRDRWWCLAYSNGGRFDIEDLGGKQQGGTETVGASEDREFPHPQRTPLRDEPRRGSGANGEGQAELTDNGESGDVAYACGERLPESTCTGQRSTRKAKRALQGCKFSRGNAESGTYWSTEPPLGRVANGVANRVNRLKMLGNGQVPLQAAYAWVMLGGPVGFK